MPADLPASIDELRTTVAEHLHTAPELLSDEDNLVALGLESITVMKLIGRWRRAGIRLRYSDLINRPTLAAWWHHLETQP
ncbi:phosphopantetheine-binding protein [Kitasatospora sp. NPDC094011]|uniref:phosphopantetheine-binding protein n=1 Tax=Kitasatospora sp. NPDC094011 TaxID=3364090 RepID=UPI00381F6F47